MLKPEAQRKHGELPKNSHLAHANRFSASDLHAGSTFTADLVGLLKAVREWQACSHTFEDILRKTPLSTRITDGSGPVANKLGTRFSHRLGGAGGIGYATDAYLARLQDILEGLIQTTQGYAQSEDNAKATITESQK